jgi:hypothetical protein
LLAKCGITPGKNCADKGTTRQLLPQAQLLPKALGQHQVNAGDGLSEASERFMRPANGSPGFWQNETTL